MGSADGFRPRAVRATLMLAAFLGWPLYFHSRSMRTGELQAIEDRNPRSPRADNRSPVECQPPCEVAGPVGSPRPHAPDRCGPSTSDISGKWKPIMDAKALWDAGGDQNLDAVLDALSAWIHGEDLAPGGDWERERCLTTTMRTFTKWSMSHPERVPPWLRYKAAAALPSILDYFEFDAWLREMFQHPNDGPSRFACRELLQSAQGCDDVFPRDTLAMLVDDPSLDEDLAFPLCAYLSMQPHGLGRDLLAKLASHIRPEVALAAKRGLRVSDHDPASVCIDAVLSPEDAVFTDDQELREGDVIVQVNSAAVRTVADFTREYARIRRNDPVVVLVLRDGAAMTASFTKTSDRPPFRLRGPHRPK